MNGDRLYEAFLWLKTVYCYQDPSDTAKHLKKNDLYSQNLNLFIKNPDTTPEMIIIEHHFSYLHRLYTGIANSLLED